MLRRLALVGDVSEGTRRAEERRGEDLDETKWEIELGPGLPGVEVDVRR